MEVDTKTGIIYCWRNVHNEKRYIGQTIHPKDRFNRHKRYLGNYNGQNHFYRAMSKYSSIDDWEYTVIEEVPKEMLDEREIYWIAFYDSMNPECGYNSREGGHNSYEYKLPEEPRRKLSEANKGKRHSEESRRKMSESLKGKPAWNKGKNLSLEHRKKISKSHKGKRHSEESRRKISESLNPNKIGVFQNDMLIAVCDTIAEASHIADVSRYVIGHIIAGRCHQTRSGYSFKYISKSA